MTSPSLSTTLLRSTHTHNATVSMLHISFSNVPPSFHEPQTSDALADGTRTQHITSALQLAPRQIQSKTSGRATRPGACGISYNTLTFQWCFRNPVSLQAVRMLQADLPTMSCIRSLYLCQVIDTPQRSPPSLEVLSSRRGADMRYYAITSRYHIRSVATLASPQFIGAG